MLCVVEEGVATTAAAFSVMLFEMDLLCFGETNEPVPRLDYLICDWAYELLLLVFSDVLLELLVLLG